MSQSLTALYLQNPQLAQAISRRARGAQMIQQGGDSSPIDSPWQGVARLAQALVGGYEQGQADKSIKAAGDEQKALMDQLQAPMGQPLQPMAEMPAAAPAAPRQPVAQQSVAPPDLDPLIQKASQETGIPAPLLTGLFAQESGFRPDARNPRSTATGIAQVLDSTAANPGYGMAPLSPEARLDPTQAIPWAAQYLARRGQSLGVTDWNNPQQAERGLRAYGENTPEYAQSVMRRAGMGAAPQGGETIPAQMPGGAPPAPRTPDAVQHWTSQAVELERRAMIAARAGQPGIAAILQQQAQGARQMAMARAPQPSEFDQLAAAAGLERGSPEYQQFARQRLERMGAPPTTTVNNNPENYAARKAIEDWGVAKDAVRDTSRRSTLFDTATQVLDSGAFKPGATADMRLKFAQFFQDLGVDTNAPAGEVLKAVQRQLELANTPKGQGQITENERVLIREMMPLMTSSEEGIRMLIEATRLLDQRDQEVFRIYNDSARKNGGVPSLVDVNEGIAALPPALPPQMVQRFSLWKETPPGDATPTSQGGTGGAWSIKPKQ